MLEQVEQKIQELKKLQAEEYYKKKDSDLNTWGLTSKKNGKKTTPIIVTDDEYEALIKASNGISKAGRNSVANTLKACAVASVLVSAVAGTTAWYMSEDMGFIWFSIAVLLGVVIALIFAGISEAIRLLQQIIDMKPLQRPDAAHVNNGGQHAGSPMPSYPQYTTAQPPIYQAPSYRQAAAQPYYSTPVAQAPVAHTNPASYGAPQNYNEMGAFGKSVQDDFFAGNYDTDPNLAEYQNGI